MLRIKLKSFGVLFAAVAAGACPASAGAAVGASPTASFVDASGQMLDGSTLIDVPAVAFDPADGSLLVHELDDPLVKDTSNTAVWSLDRWYNSTTSTTSRDVGAGWLTGLGYDVRLARLGDGRVQFFAPGGASATFAPSGDGSYASSDSLADGNASLFDDPSGYRVALGDEGRTLYFDTSGLGSVR